MEKTTMTINEITICSNATLQEITEFHDRTAPHLRLNIAFISRTTGVYQNYTEFPDSEILEEFVSRCSRDTINEFPLLYAIHCKMMHHNRKVLPTNSELDILYKGIIFHYRPTKNEIEEVFYRVSAKENAKNTVFISEDGAYYYSSDIISQFKSHKAILLEWARGCNYSSIKGRLPKGLEKSALLDKLFKELYERTLAKSEDSVGNSTSLLLTLYKK